MSVDSDREKLAADLSKDASAVVFEPVDSTVRGNRMAASSTLRAARRGHRRWGVRRAPNEGKSPTSFPPASSGRTRAGAMGSGGAPSPPMGVRGAVHGETCPSGDHSVTKRPGL